MKTSLKNKKGITLIALVVTIVVLLILAGISISMLSGENGIISQAQKAKDDTEQSKIEELVTVAVNGLVLENLGNKNGITPAMIATEINNMQNRTDIEAEKDTFPTNILFKSEGRKVGVNIDLKIEECIHEWNDGVCSNCGKEITEHIAGKKVYSDTTYIQNGKKAVIPEGFTMSGAESEMNIDDGLVIYLIDDMTDAEIGSINWEDEEELEYLRTTYDQFVWTSISDINDMYMCQSEDGTKSCNITVQNGTAICTTHNSTLMAGRLYRDEATGICNFTITTQTFNGASVKEPGIVTELDATNLSTISDLLGTEGYEDTTVFQQTLQDEYNEIVKSVYENGGFYIGRYEVSNISEPTVIAGAMPSYMVNWYYMYGTLKKYSSYNNIKARTSMIQGAAYDQIMRFVHTDTYDVFNAGNVAQSNLSTVEQPYNSGGRDYEERYQIEIGETGYIPYKDVSKNIYDLEGNIRCWTTTLFSDTHRLVRGGTRSGGYYGDAQPASQSNTIGPGSGSTGTKDGGVMMLYI